MKTVAMDISKEIGEARALLQKQRELGLTLLARAFTEKFNRSNYKIIGRMTPRKEQWLKNQREKLYNQDGEASLKLANEYLKSMLIFRVGLIIALISWGIVKVLPSSNTGVYIFSGAAGLLSLMMGLAMLCLALVNKLSVTSYTIRLAKAWRETKKVLVKHAVDIHLGEEILPSKLNLFANQRDIEKTIEEITGTFPEQASEHHRKIKPVIQEMLNKLAEEVLRAQSRADISDEKKARKKMSQIIDAGRKTEEVFSYELPNEMLGKAFRSARTRLEAGKKIS